MRLHNFRRRPVPARLAALAAMALAPLLTAGCGDDEQIAGLLSGETHQVYGGPVNTWARLNTSGQVSQVGATMPAATVTGAPAAATRHDGEGPAGAVGVLSFPDVVRATTFFDHLELHWNPEGHPPPGIYSPEHFDMHFYAVPVSQVQAIDCTDLTLPTADRVPEGWQADVNPQTQEAVCVPQMGIHASPLADFTAGVPFQRTMIYGYYGGQLTFLEPMVTRQFLVDRETYDVTLPVPDVVDIQRLFPRRFQLWYDEALDAYQMVFSDFVLP